jgi:dolichyl-diphosphooligosaccharide--protein glycosyltransferase
LLIVWGISALVLAILQRRFVYYLAPVMCIMCAYTIVLLSKGLIDKYKGYESKVVSVTVISIFCLVFMLIPNTTAAIKQNSSSVIAPTNAWLSACDWLKNNTEQPYTNINSDGVTLQSSNYYYSIYNKDENDSRINYRVLTWWDYGYWIVRIAHRPVMCSPGGGETSVVAGVLLSNSYNKELVNKLKVKYIVIDYTMLGLKYSNIQYSANSSVSVEDTFMYRVWNKYDNNFIECWGSKEKYGKDSQVKIFIVKE